MGPLAATLVLLAAAPVLLPGCKPVREEPEHVRQQRAAETERQRRLAAARQALPDASAEREPDWPAPVAAAYLELLRAGSIQTPQAAQNLAQLGREAVQALRRLIGSRIQPEKKRALASFMLVDLHMFRPDDLAALAREQEMPFAQRAAIESLARIGGEHANKLLDALRAEMASQRDRAGKAAASERGPAIAAGGHAAQGAAPGVPSAPDAGPQGTSRLDLFIDRARQQARPWGYSERQLFILDQLLGARDQKEADVALRWITDLSLEEGLLALVASPVTPVTTAGPVSGRLLALSSKDSRRLRRLCAPGAPPPLRLEAARVLLEAGRRADRAYLERMAAQSADPLAPMLQELLSGERPGAPPAAAGKKRHPGRPVPDPPVRR